MTYRNVILLGDVRERLREMPAESVQMVCTSPPYWGLRDYSVGGQLGLEATPDEYVATMVDVFREVKRVLRKDGTCWVNLGDSYAQGPSGARTWQGGGQGGETAWTGNQRTWSSTSPGLKPKDLCGIPWRVALALQADGWWLRSEIIWAKPNPMPESVTDRPTKAHETIFLLTKSAKYFYDAEAVREKGVYSAEQVAQQARAHKRRAEEFRVRSDGGINPVSDFGRVLTESQVEPYGTGNRNARTVWTIATESFPDAHFATYPTELVKKCIQAGTSEHGCCSTCGAPWRRAVEKTYLSPIITTGNEEGRYELGRGRNVTRMGDGVDVRTTGWQPSCTCESPVEPCLVLDPFMGSGTTAIAAWRAARDYVGIELNPAYLAMAEARLAESKQQGRLL